MIPLLHDFEGERVLVFGGGSVGLRKVRRFAGEAEVVVVAPAFDERVPAAEMVRASPAADEDAGTSTVAEWFDRVEPALAVAATDDAAVNAAVERAARERGVLVNRADESGERDAGSVVVPATVRDGSVVASVATGGLSPALSKHLRERIEPELDGAGRVAEAAAELRGDLRDRPPEERRDALRAVVDSDRVWRAAREGEDVRATAERVAEEALDG
ncbi:precorrin-2 dehydrogenase/sirohydrochlorin ferrochelatase family protein [Halomicrococcus sp. NG-SE-24]|uniref:precorrin-2 dehydrogenase/sirohydrochlorin ferrochelatase family protein n=1 Tax=Halomicrococcus sp. NG-SE-24 TaxID=3436928 RepID=UPI003D967386